MSDKYCFAIAYANYDIRSSSAQLLGTTQLQQLCESSCRSDLTSLQKSIAKACIQETDVMVPTDNIAYPGTYCKAHQLLEYNSSNMRVPATFLVDRYLYVSSLSCLKDR